MTPDLIWKGTLVLAAVSLALGIFISLITQIFYVKENPLAAKIYDILPHFNCGACGYPGCQPYANALGDKIEPVHTKCRPGKEAVAEKILALLNE
ncbi:MAG: RnfABCDGE type electron transport complex subunit B [Brevinema sp.]